MLKHENTPVNNFYEEKSLMIPNVNNSYIMMETEITSDWIDRYNDNELDETEKAIFQKRMVANPLLCSEVCIDARLNHFLQDNEVMDLMTKIRSVSQRNADGSRRLDSLLIAASLLCLVMIGGIFYLLRTNMVKVDLYGQQHSEQQKQKNAEYPVKLNYPPQFDHNYYHDSLPIIKAIHPGMIAKNFEPLAEFELLIGSVTRSYQFKLISPDMNISISAGTAVLFAWRQSGNMMPVCIVVINNHGIPVSEITIKHGNTYTLKTKGFREGLYYWKIVMDDGMVLMGKYTIL